MHRAHPSQSPNLMRTVVYAVFASAAILSLVTATPIASHAQTAEGLEQTYARLCGAGQQTEVCTLLRQGLTKKLTGETESSPSPSPSSAGSTGSGSVAAVAFSASDSAVLDRACSSGSASQCAQLGIRFYTGNGLTKDLAKAGAFFQLACENGELVDNCGNAGTLYLGSQYSPSDPARLGTLVAQACEGENAASSCHVAGVMYDRYWNSHSNFPHNDALSAKYFQRACDLGQATSCTALAGMYDGVGRGVKPNRQVSTSLYDRGCVAGDPRACTIIGLAYAQGRPDVPKDRERALAYYRRGCESPVTAEEDPNGEKARSCRWLTDLQNAPAVAAADDDSKKGGLFRTILGAGMGVAAARAGGMDAEQTVGMAAKGVALMNPESQAAQVIGGAGDAVLESSGLGTAGAGAASAGSKASYPTKPNMLAGQAACSMMNESNYRQVAVSGGNDVQLKAMCGQAYEYYVMYKRAISQGYSEADANRTYSAHEQSARVAINFYTNNR